MKSTSPWESTRSVPPRAPFAVPEALRVVEPQAAISTAPALTAAATATAETDPGRRFLRPVDMAAPLTTPREPSRALGNTAWSADHLPFPGPPSSRTVRRHDPVRAWRVGGPVDGRNRRSDGRGRAPSAGRLAQGRHVQHAHPAPGRLDPSERPHGVKRSPDGLERCARPAGELLLGERKRDVDKVAVRFSEAAAQLGGEAPNPCEAVVRREQPALLVGLAQALAQQPQQ